MELRLTIDPQQPVIKIGAVVLRARAVPQVLILRPIPKKAGEKTGFVLPRGTRQYFLTNAQGEQEWHDARELAVAIAHAATLEPEYRALQREIREEAGVTGDMLAVARVEEMGVRLFQSRSKGEYPIHWYVVVPREADAAQLTLAVPEDALETRWATLVEIKDMVTRQEFTGGYVPVIEEALARAMGAA